MLPNVHDFLWVGRNGLWVRCKTISLKCVCVELVHVASDGTAWFIRNWDVTAAHTNAAANAFD